MDNYSIEWTVLTMLEWGTSFFEKKNIKNPRLSIEWLLSDILNIKRLDLYLMYDKPLAKSELSLLRPLVKRRALGEPLQYITGSTDFYGYTIKVDPSVLIPRPETEELLELVLTQSPYVNKRKVLDIGTGSGCISIALKKKRPNWNCHAIDISKEAIRVAKDNALAHEIEIEFFIEDIINPSSFLLNQSYDLIISNPPYILRSEYSTIDVEVKAFEPNIALFTSSL